ncbi:MAG: hypothetical protein H7A21_09505 [Spirochaetales bacterium]|nr:hypothetical protein [Spirochaetales bacterium]
MASEAAPSNAQVIELLGKIADLLELEGAQFFRVRAYREATDTIRGLDEPLAALVARGAKLTDLPGIGKELAAKLTEFVTTGKLAYLDQLAEKTPLGLLSVLRVPGLGAKRVRLLYDSLGVTSLEELEEAARNQKLRELPGLGAKIESDILRRLERLRAPD